MPRLAVRLTPRGGTDRIEGVAPDGSLRVRVAAPPVDGQANAALLRLLAQAVGAPAGAVTIERGGRGRQKLVRVEGIDAASLAGRWPGLLVEDERR